MFTPQRAHATMSSPCDEPEGFVSPRACVAFSTPFTNHQARNAIRIQNRRRPNAAVSVILRGNFNLEAHAAAAFEVAGPGASPVELGDEAHDEKAEPQVHVAARVTGVAHRDHRIEERRHDRVAQRRPIVLDREDPLQIQCLIRLAEIAQDAGTMDEGIAAAKRARQLAVERGDEVGALRAELEIESITSHIDPTYEWGRFRALLDRAQPVLERGGDHEGLVRLWLLRAEIANVDGQWAADAAACRRAIEHAESAGRPDLARHAMPPMMVASYLGPVPFERVAEDARQMIASGNGLPAMEGGWTWVGLVQVFSGSTEEGFANLRRGRAALRDLGLVIPLAGSRALEADAYMAVGDLASAADELRTGAAALREFGESAVLSTVTGYLSVVLAESGELNEAEQAAAESRSTATADDIASQLMWREGLAVVRARQGEHSEAERLARQAVKLSQSTDSPTFQAMAASALATVLAAGGHREQAMTAHREAIKLYERKGNHTMAARLRREGPVVSAPPSSARPKRRARAVVDGPAGQGGKGTLARRPPKRPGD